MDQTQTPRYVSRFVPLLYIPTFTQKNFHYVNTGPPQREPPQTNLQLQTWSIQLLYPIQPPLLKRQGTNPKLNHNHLYTRAIGTELKLNHLYTRGIGTKPKQRKDNNLGDHNRPQKFFSQKQDPIDR